MEKNQNKLANYAIELIRDKKNHNFSISILQMLSLKTISQKSYLSFTSICSARLTTFRTSGFPSYEFSSIPKTIKQPIKTIRNKTTIQKTSATTSLNPQKFHLSPIRPNTQIHLHRTRILVERHGDLIKQYKSHQNHEKKILKKTTKNTDSRSFRSSHQGSGPQGPGLRRQRQRRHWNQRSGRGRASHRGSWTP